MNRDKAYKVLRDELEARQLRSYDDLLALVDQPAVSRIVRLGQEDVTVRVWVRWKNPKKGTLLIKAAADGPSCWRLDRVEESIVVHAQEAV